VFLCIKASLGPPQAQLKFDRGPREFSQDDINSPASELLLAVVAAVKTAPCLALAAKPNPVRSFCDETMRIAIGAYIIRRH
jgi:hypothetical protein